MVRKNTHMNSKNSPDCLFWLYQDNYRTYNLEVAKCLGINAAILLSQLASKHKYFRDHGSLTADGYFYYTHQDLEDHTALSPEQQEKAIGILISNGLIVKKVFGIPPKRFFFLCERAIMDFFFYSEKIKEPSQSVSANFRETRKLISVKSGNTSYTHDPKIHEPKKIIIADSEEDGTLAAGNNNFYTGKLKKQEKKVYQCLEECQDFSITQKRVLTAKYKDEQCVKKCMEFIYHKDGPEILGGPIAKLKYLKHMLNNPESYKDTLDELGQPKLTKAQQQAKDDEIKASEFKALRERNKKRVHGFKSGVSYNGWVCKISDDWFEMRKKSDNTQYMINFGDKDFDRILKNVAHKLKIIEE